MNINQLKGIAMGLILGFATVLCAEESTFNALVPAPRGVFDELKAKTITSLDTGQPLLIKGKLRVEDTDSKGIRFQIDPSGIYARTPDVRVFSPGIHLYAKDDFTKPYLSIEPRLPADPDAGGAITVQNKLVVQLQDGTEVARLTQVNAAGVETLVNSEPILFFGTKIRIGTKAPADPLSVAGDAAIGGPPGPTTSPVTPRTLRVVGNVEVLRGGTSGPVIALGINNIRNDSDAATIFLDSGDGSFHIDPLGRNDLSNADDLILMRNGGPGTVNMGLGAVPTVNPSPANNQTTGNLDVNDVYLRSVDRWASQKPSVTSFSLLTDPGEGKDRDIGIHTACFLNFVKSNFATNPSVPTFLYAVNQQPGGNWILSAWSLTQILEVGAVCLDW